MLITLPTFFFCGDTHLYVEWHVCRTKVRDNWFFDWGGALSRVVFAGISFAALGP